MRQFKGGAIRDISSGKINYYGVRHPLCEHSFGEYIRKSNEDETGRPNREANNWWTGWDKEVSIQSLNRHLEDLNAICCGMKVAKVRSNGRETTVYLPKDAKVPEGAKLVSESDCCNAIRFNSMTYLLEIIRQNNGK